ncbi:arginase family protein [Limibacter armeniacum]|uniref:arginase family protein n=1 Tax=Limibacter armeniacum TaxID=466084 RepID=UPI002FE5F33C
MELKQFFHPIAQDTLPVREAGTMSDNTDFHIAEHFPDWEAADIALVFVPEYRGLPLSENPKNGFVKFRKQLYNLKDLTVSCKIVDLGELITGALLSDTYDKLQKVCEYLLANNTLPLIIGGSHDLDLAQVKAYHDTEKTLGIVGVDAKPDMEQSGIPSEEHLFRILELYPSKIEYSHLAYQRFITDKNTLLQLSKLNADLTSIGQIRDNLQETEPVIRSANILSFDISAIRKSECQGAYHNNIFGLTPEEACQLCWYAGLNEQLTSVGFYNYAPKKDIQGDTAMLLSVMVWYFVEGYSKRRPEYSFFSNFHTKYIIPIDESLQTLVFYKSKLSDKWWMEVAFTEDETPVNGQIIPCSYKDYQDALEGNLPDRWIKAVGKVKDC